ncbi:MAG TPA: helix-hairpin-helix domain-containing protein [Caldimonas sp.]|nr:helix-hairpin-helix domain-containing protein [Caldimonas sp.]
MSLIGAMAAVVLAAPALGTPNTAGAPAAVPDPHAAVAAAPVTGQPAAMPRHHGPTVVEHYVDLNSASRKELMTLPGIGKAEADRIVAHRPYLVKSDLVTKNVLPIGPFLSIKYLVVAMPKSVAQGKH